MYHTAFPAIFSRSRRRTQQHPVNVPAKEKRETLIRARRFTSVITYRRSRRRRRRRRFAPRQRRNRVSVLRTTILQLSERNRRTFPHDRPSKYWPSRAGWSRYLMYREKRARIMNLWCTLGAITPAWSSSYYREQSG